MRYNLGTALRGLISPDVVAEWEQVTEALRAKSAREDLVYDLDEIIFSMRDILLILDNEAD